MNKADDRRYFAIILEEIRDQNRAVLEAVGAMQPLVARIPKIEADVEQLKQDMKTVKAVMTSFGRQLTNHEQRITRLEAKA